MREICANVTRQFYPWAPGPRIGCSSATHLGGGSQAPHTQEAHYEGTKEGNPLITQIEENTQCGGIALERREVESETCLGPRQLRL